MWVKYLSQGDVNNLSPSILIRRCVVNAHLCGEPCKLAGKQGCLEECTKVGAISFNHMHQYQLFQGRGTHGERSYVSSLCPYMRRGEQTCSPSPLGLS